MGQIEMEKPGASGSLLGGNQQEQEGRVSVVMTGPEIEVGPFVLFSTGLGDAWLLSPDEDLCMCLMWHGEVNEPKIQDTPTQIKIGWDARYQLIGPFMHLDPIDLRMSWWVSP